MKKIILVISLLVLLFLQLYSTNQKIIKVGIYNNPPKIYLDKNKKPSGFWAELTEYIAKKENFKIEWKFDNWQQCLNNLKNQSIDIMVDVGETPDREKIYLFNKIPVLISWVRLYKAKGTNINSILDLENKKVGALKGSFDLNGPEGLRNTVKNFAINCDIIELDSYEEIFRSLNDKKIDAGVVDADFGNKNESNYNIEKTFILFQPAQMKYAFPKNKKYKNLINILDKNLSVLKNNKSSIYYHLLDKYLIGRKEITIYPKNLKYYLLAILLLFVIVMIFNFILKYQVDKKTKILKNDLEIIKDKEKKIKHLNAILQTIKNINRLISNENNLKNLIKYICHEIIKSQSYKRSWIALYDKTDNLVAFASLGFEKDEKILKNIMQKPAKPYKVYEVLNSNSVTIIKNPKQSCPDCPLSEKLKNEILMMVKLSGKNIKGIFSVSVPNIKLFSEKEVELFQNLSEDISFRIATIELESEKLKAEKRLFESEKKYRAIVEQAFEGISLFDLEKFKIIDANRAYLDMLGYTKEELKNLNLEDLVANIEKMKKNLKDLHNCSDVKIIQCNLKRKDGKIINTEISSTTIKLNEKKIILSVIRDITEKLKTEEKLRKAEENYRILAETMPDLVVIIDLKGKILYVNPAAEKLGKQLKKEIIGRFVSEFVLPEDIKLVKENLAKRNAGNKSTYRYEIILDDRKGFRKPFEVTSTPITENGKITKILLIAHDISTRKKQMEIIKNNLKEKEILLRELYHRTKNNMQIISSLISIQSHKLKDENLKNIFKEIINKINSMALVHQKLYETKNLNQINLKDYIYDLFELLKQSYYADTNNLKITMDLNDCQIGIDQALNLGLIINELITNIFKYGISESGETKIYIGLKKTAQSIVLQVEDNGYKLNKNADLRKFQSMGLRTVFSLVEYKLKGKISYKIDNGLKWYIEFPVQ